MKGDRVRRILISVLAAGALAAAVLAPAGMASTTSTVSIVGCAFGGGAVVPSGNSITLRFGWGGRGSGDLGGDVAAGDQRHLERPLPGRADIRRRLRLRVARPSGRRDRPGTARLARLLSGQLHPEDDLGRPDLHRDPPRSCP